MSTQRNELAREIHSTEQLGCGCCTDYNYTREQDQHADKLDVNTRAVAIGDTLLAAGWTKPRTITTVEELDALPVGSVVLVRRRAWTRFEPKQIAGALVEIHKWMCPDGGILRADSDQDIILPATVLHEPTA